MTHEVFISYSSHDKNVADAVCAALEARKIRCWIAPRDALPGAPYGEELVNAISASRVLVLIFSASADASPQVLREVERAASKGIPILPLRIEDVKPTHAMEYFISASHWLDALTPPLERHLPKLANTVERLLAGKSAPPAQPIPPRSRPRRLRPALTGVAVLIVAVAVVAGLASVWPRAGGPVTSGTPASATQPSVTGTAAQAATPAPARSPGSMPVYTPLPRPTRIATVPDALGPMNASQVVALQTIDTDRILHLRWSPDGQSLAAASFDVRLYTRDTWQPRYAIGGVRWANGLDVSPAGTALVTAGSGGATLWDAGTGAESRTLPGTEGATGVAFGPDGGLLATSAGETVQVWDLASGQVLFALPAGGATGGAAEPLAFSPDGQQLACGTDRGTVIWDTATGEEIQRAVIIGVTNQIRAVVFSPDGSRLVIRDIEGRVRLWTGPEAHGESLPPIRPGPSAAMAFSPDGRLFATAGSGGTIQLWDVASWSALATLDGHTDDVLALAFSPDGALLASGGEDRTLRIWGVP